VTPYVLLTASGAPVTVVAHGLGALAAGHPGCSSAGSPTPGCETPHEATGQCCQRCPTGLDAARTDIALRRLVALADALRAKDAKAVLAQVMAELPADVLKLPAVRAHA